jgi:hypothetical protein
MPAKRLDAVPVDLRRYDVVGQDSADVLSLVRHVALCASEQTQVSTAACEVRLTHMIPPFRVNDETDEVHVAGWALLSADEMMQIQVFVDELDLEYRAQARRSVFQYVILPHFREPTEDVPLRRFNCAGLAIEAYKYAGIDLVRIDETLPRVSLDSLKEAYPDHADTLDSKRLREALGLNESEDNSWPVVMAGYVINSLNRPLDEIRQSPYTPKSGDKFFPSS